MNFNSDSSQIDLPLDRNAANVSQSSASRDSLLDTSGSVSEKCSTVGVSEENYNRLPTSNDLVSKVKLNVNKDSSGSTIRSKTELALKSAEIKRKKLEEDHLRRCEDIKSKSEAKMIQAEIRRRKINEERQQQFALQKDARLKKMNRFNQMYSSCYADLGNVSSRSSTPNKLSKSNSRTFCTPRKFSLSSIQINNSALQYNACSARHDFCLRPGSADPFSPFHTNVSRSNGLAALIRSSTKLLSISNQCLSKDKSVHDIKPKTSLNEKGKENDKNLIMSKSVINLSQSQSFKTSMTTSSVVKSRPNPPFLGRSSPKLKSQPTTAMLDLGSNNVASVLDADTIRLLKETEKKSAPKRILSNVVKSNGLDKNKSQSLSSTLANNNKQISSSVNLKSSQNDTYSQPEESLEEYRLKMLNQRRKMRETKSKIETSDNSTNNIIVDSSKDNSVIISQNLHTESIEVSNSTQKLASEIMQVSNSDNQESDIAKIEPVNLDCTNEASNVLEIKSNNFIAKSEEPDLSLLDSQEVVTPKSNESVIVSLTEKKMNSQDSVDSVVPSQAEDSKLEVKTRENISTIDKNEEKNLKTITFDKPVIETTDTIVSSQTKDSKANMETSEDVSTVEKNEQKNLKTVSFDKPAIETAQSARQRAEGILNKFKRTQTNPAS